MLSRGNLSERGEAATRFRRPSELEELAQRRLCWLRCVARFGEVSPALSCLGYVQITAVEVDWPRERQSVQGGWAPAEEGGNPRF